MTRPAKNYLVSCLKIIHNVRAISYIHLEEACSQDPQKIKPGSPKYRHEALKNPTEYKPRQAFNNNNTNYGRRLGGRRAPEVFAARLHTASARKNQ
ncbi:hypothetical protein VTN77DRAFT_358 [Rasamsonia byssochlamydoides]|uniref:uncharacterized protein n=1 Tax=Rasamsonia byssochlamydoides TaxID=89139 RepID=UPI003744608F